MNNVVSYVQLQSGVCIHSFQPTSTYGILVVMDTRCETGNKPETDLSCFQPQSSYPWLKVPQDEVCCELITLVGVVTVVLLQRLPWLLLWPYQTIKYYSGRDTVAALFSFLNICFLFFENCTYIVLSEVLFNGLSTIFCSTFCDILILEIMSSENSWYR